MPAGISPGRAGHLVGRAVLMEAARLLQASGVLLMPLKGIALHELAYDDPDQRPITDVDVLVPEREYQRALKVLRSAGWRYLGSNVSEASLCAPGLPLPLDVHQRLFTRGAFRMPSDELFARGRYDEQLFGVPLILPDPYDLLAHLVGHFVKSRGGPDTESVQLRDFGQLASRARLTPVDTAAHLQRCGLARAARYALTLAAAHDASAFCRSTLTALPADPVGRACAAAMLRLRAHSPTSARCAALPGFLLERSLPAAAATFALRAWDRRHDLRVSA